MPYIPPVFFLMVLFAYLLGSIPFGFLIAKAQGIDLRIVGSGNIGATNTARALGKKWGILCMLLDILKGLVPMLVVREQNADPLQLTLWLLIGCAAVLGHVFPVYLKFKGGKGVATSLGIVLGLWPYYTLCGIAAFAVWVIFLLIWRYVSVASIAAAICFPVFLGVAILYVESWKIRQLWPLLIIAVLMALLVVIRHTDNIKRLMEGTENKSFQTKTAPTDD